MAIEQNHREMEAAKEIALNLLLIPLCLIFEFGEFVSSSCYGIYCSGREIGEQWHIISPKGKP